MLVVLPAGSWFFLKWGLDWRRVKAKELVSKEQVLDLEKLRSESNPFAQRIKGKTTLLKTSDKQTDLDLDLVDQFKDAYTFHAEFLSPEELNSIAEQMQGNFDYILIDTAGQVRQMYTGMDTSVMTRVVEDVALILPQRKPIDIKMKNNPEIE